MENLPSLFETSDADSWVASLPLYQRRSIIEMRGKGASYDEIASTWIAAGASNTAPFSSGNPPPPDPNFLDKLRLEVRAYLCGDKKYDEDRKQLLAGGKEIHAYVVSGMSLAIAPYLGATGIIIAPVIALVLAGIGKMSLNAWCAMP
jgi:hypothetical protein